jgi:hypothetical protein
MSKENLEEHSIAYSIIKEYKKINKGLIVINILLLIALIIAIVF